MPAKPSWLLNIPDIIRRLSALVGHDRRSVTVLEPIAVFTDGSFYDEVKHGAWAFSIPLLGMEGSGAGTGRDIARFELMAVVRALAQLLEMDRTCRPINVMSDCIQTGQWIAALKDPDSATMAKLGRSLDQDLLRELVQVISERTVTFTSTSNTLSPAHAWCHRTARKTLRAAIDADASLKKQLMVCRHLQKCQQLNRERDALKKRLTVIEKRLFIQMNAVESLLERPSVDPLSAES
jgi:ribonuclease HI